MRVLIVHASRYGSTQGIAERIAAALAQRDVETTVKAVGDAGNPADYDAVVIGSAIYYLHWMKRALRYVQGNQAVLAGKPVWLFSSGPLGTKTIDDKGRDVRALTEPKQIAEFREMIHPRDHRVFFGAMQPKKLGFLHRLIFNMPANRDNALFPVGDFRDWNDIDTWAGKIADDLKALAGGAAALAQETVQTA